MTKYINEPTVLRLKPEGIEKPDSSDKKYWINRFYNIQEFDKDLSAYNATHASQPTFLKIGDGWEKYKEGDTVDGSEVDFSYQIASNGWWADTSKEGYEQYIGDAYKRIVARLKNKEAGEESEDEYKPSIYIASKTRHANKWIALREKGINIISTWIYEAGEGQTKDMNDLCFRCINESLTCDAMIVYIEDGDVLKGAFIEMGVALSVKLKPIYLVGEVLKRNSVFTYSHQVLSAKSIEHALQMIKKDFAYKRHCLNNNSKTINP
jgi:hypothetical protein